MCQFVRLCMVWFFAGIAVIPATVFADDIDPRPGSQSALNSLAYYYGLIVIETVKFEVENKEILDSNLQLNYQSYREQILATVLRGLDNIDNSASDQLVFDLSGVSFGEATDPLYACLVQRKARKLAKYLKKGRSPTEWCTKELPATAAVCRKKEDALLLLRYNIKKANPKCDSPLYP
ncbi:hypothetical protein [Verminephrobacter aporrectodeae]|uniref:hypothetical protein n=1 Tax=Verminephrobacter aporrectodeae TaxID=1110389 RepID=UPI002238D769|nr:hypothetical protein [Verminephrobacter aporrectodeae]